MPTMVHALECHHILPGYSKSSTRQSLKIWHIDKDAPHVSGVMEGPSDEPTEQCAQNGKSCGR